MVYKQRYMYTFNWFNRIRLLVGKGGQLHTADMIYI